VQKALGAFNGGLADLGSEILMHESVIQLDTALPDWADMQHQSDGEDGPSPEKMRVENSFVVFVGQNESYLRIAVAQAIRSAMHQAGGQLPGPIMKCEVVVPEESMGTTLGDLQSRRAIILDTSTEHGVSTLKVECALARMLGYATELRSLTRGRGQFTTCFERFDVTD